MVCVYEEPGRSSRMSGLQECTIRILRVRGVAKLPKKKKMCLEHRKYFRGYGKSILLFFFRVMGKLGASRVHLGSRISTGSSSVQPCPIFARIPDPPLRVLPC